MYRHINGNIGAVENFGGPSGKPRRFIDFCQPLLRPRPDLDVKEKRNDF